MSTTGGNNPRVVLDTNVYVSAILFGGTPEIIFNLGRRGLITILTSRPILVEISRVLSTKMKMERPDVRDALITIRQTAELILPLKKISAIRADDPDNRILECAVEGRADAIVTGDKKHVRALGSFKGIPIYLPAEFIQASRQGRFPVS